MNDSFELLHKNILELDTLRQSQLKTAGVCNQYNDNTMWINYLKTRTQNAGKTKKSNMSFQSPLCRILFEKNNWTFDGRSNCQQ
jgi:hypothetical protein